VLESCAGTREGVSLIDLWIYASTFRTSSSGDYQRQSLCQSSRIGTSGRADEGAIHGWARIEPDNHEETHPGYKFCPTKLGQDSFEDGPNGNCIQVCRNTIMTGTLEAKITMSDIKLAYEEASISSSVLNLSQW
jgi:hypothetical protein